MVTYWQNYVIHVTPHLDMIVKHWVSNGVVNEYNCIGGVWDNEPPEELKSWWEKRILSRVVV